MRDDGIITATHFVELMRLIISMCPKSISYPSMNMYTSFHTYLCPTTESQSGEGRRRETSVCDGKFATGCCRFRNREKFNILTEFLNPFGT